ncbi:hypothetical protein RB620_24525 [Paenibacillus sp. LHD-117]|nr:hypothetical protein [Paenibacillus sp. LHD-117]MDQ6422602.1 hypothetical protein [Paenibacillus sp. LHD-117]
MSDKSQNLNELRAETEAAYQKAMAAWDKFISGLNKSYGINEKKEQ